MDGLVQKWSVAAEGPALCIYRDRLRPRHYTILATSISVLLHDCCVSLTWFVQVSCVADYTLAILVL